MSKDETAMEFGRMQRKCFLLLMFSFITPIFICRKLFRMKYSIEKLANDEDEDFTGSEHEILERSLSKSSKQQSNGSIKTGSQKGDQNGQSTNGTTNDESKSDSNFMVDHDPLSFDQLEQFAKHLSKKLSVKHGKLVLCFHLAYLTCFYRDNRA